MKRFLFVALLAVLCGMIYTNTRPIPTQITDTPEPLRLKQDDVEIPSYCGNGMACSQVAPAGWDKPTVLEEIDSPVVLSVSSSKAYRPPFTPHYKIWKTISSTQSTSSSRSSAVSSAQSSEQLSAPKPSFCSRTGTGARAQKRVDYCNSIR